MLSLNCKKGTKEMILLRSLFLSSVCVVELQVHSLAWIQFLTLLSACLLDFIIIYSVEKLYQIEG